MPTNSETEIALVSPAESAIPPSVYDGVEAWEINDQRTSAYCRKTVRKETWKRVIQEYPALKGKPDLLRLFYWCVFGAKDEETGSPLIGAHHCANAERKQLTRNYRPLKLLVRFQQAVGGSEVFDWSDYSYRERKCRIVKHFRIPPSLSRVLTEELYANPHASTRVYLESGRIFRRAKAKAATAKQTKELEDIRLKLKPLITEAAFQKLRKCRYRINRDILDQGFLRSLPQFEKSTIDHRESIMAALRHVNFHRDGAIYTPQWNMQSNGRMYTIGGLMALPGYVRKAIMRPVEKGNLLVEVDAISAHLLFNCDRFGCPEVKELLLESSRSTGTVWHVIGDPDMKKKLKKPIVYGFCYGSRYSNLPYHANNHFIKQYGYNYGVTLKHVDACLKQGILAPLVEAREEWIQRHNHSGVIGTLNLLEYAFEPTTKDCGCCVENLGSRLLAHLNFGEEQYHLQQLIAKCPYNVICFQYDGFTYEVPPTELEHSKKLLSELTNIPLSFEVVYASQTPTLRASSDGCNREGRQTPINPLNEQKFSAAETLTLSWL